VQLVFPSGRIADELVVANLAQLAWIINLGCIDLNPHPVRFDDLDHPDELRVDLDPGPGVTWPAVRETAVLVGEVLDELGLTGWPKTLGSRGMHVNIRIERRWPSRAKSSAVPPISSRASGGKKSATASSSTTTKTPRTAPWLQPIPSVRRLRIARTNRRRHRDRSLRV